MEFLRVNTESEPQMVETAETAERLEAGLDLSDLDPEGAVDAVEVGEEPEEPGVTLDELAEEIRRVGRELFKTNRASERNEELFESALDELRQLAGRVAQAPDVSAEVAFQAKASLGVELLEVLDSLEASLGAAREVLAKLGDETDRPTSGIAFQFPAARRMRDALGEAVETMRRWHEGQELLSERLAAALRATSIRAMEPTGRPFDPLLQRAVAVEQRADLPAGTVVGEERKGYVLDGRVLRYAEVRVSR